MRILVDTAIVVLIIIGLISAYLAASRLFEQARFRKVIAKRGMTCEALQNTRPEEGTIIVDYVYGRSMGIGMPIIWWTPKLAEQGGWCEDIIDVSRVVDLPAGLRNSSELKARFPDHHIVESNTLCVKFRIE